MKTAVAGLIGISLLAGAANPALTPALGALALASGAPATAPALVPSPMFAIAKAVAPADSDVDPALTQIVADDETFANVGERVEISAGHVDMGATLTDSFELMARDDTNSEPVWRHLDDVVFVIGEAGKLAVPDDAAYSFTQADGEAWVIPQHEIEGVPWLGWNTQHPQLVKEAPDGVDLIFEGHEGPGVLTTFVEAGNFSGPQVIWDSTREQGQPIHIEPSTHTHLSWVFTEPGEHLVRITAQARVGDEVMSDTQVLRFAVGPQASIAAAHDLAWPDTSGASSADSADEVEAGASSAMDDNAKGEGGLAVSVGIGVGIAALVIAIGGAVMHRMGKSRKEEALS